MERYHIFKLGLAILFYAAYCIRPMMVYGLKIDEPGTQNLNNKTKFIADDDYIYYQGVQGKPGVDFPVLSHIPRTTFSCREMESGYYADLETDCQVFHICEENKKISFLCPNGTIFQQGELICEWWFKVNCTNSPSLYEESAEQLREDNARRKSSRRVNLSHGAVMRTEEQSSVRASQNGRSFEVHGNSKNYQNGERENRINNHANEYRKSNRDKADLSQSSSSDFVRGSNNNVNEEITYTVEGALVPNNKDSERRKNNGGRKRQRVPTQAQNNGKLEGGNLPNGNGNHNYESTVHTKLKSPNQDNLSEHILEVKKVPNNQRKNPKPEQNRNSNYRGGNFQESFRTDSGTDNNNRPIFNQNGNGRVAQNSFQYQNSDNQFIKSTTNSPIVTSRQHQNQNSFQYQHSGRQVVQTTSKTPTVNYNQNLNQNSLQYKSSTNSPSEIYSTNQNQNSFQYENSGQQGVKTSTNTPVVTSSQNQNQNSFQYPISGQQVVQTSTNTPNINFNQNQNQNSFQYESSGQQVVRSSTNSPPETYSTNHNQKNFQSENSGQEGIKGSTNTPIDTSVQTNHRNSFYSVNSRPESTTNVPIVLFEKSGQHDGFTAHNQEADISNTGPKNDTPNDQFVNPSAGQVNSVQSDANLPNNQYVSLSAGKATVVENYNAPNNQYVNLSAGSVGTVRLSSSNTSPKTTQPASEVDSQDSDQYVNLSVGQLGSIRASSPKPNPKITLTSGSHKPVTISVSTSDTLQNSKNTVPQKSTIPLTRNDIVTSQLEPNESDESQITQETASFYKNSFNRIEQSVKPSTFKSHPNHRETYEDVKEPSYYSTKVANAISSVTPQYLTTQPINNGRPFLGSQVGGTTLKASNLGSTSGSSHPTTIIAVYGRTTTTTTTPKPSTSSPIESSTNRIIDHATVYGSFSRPSTTPVPLRTSSTPNVEVQFSGNSIAVSATPGTTNIPESTGFFVTKNSNYGSSLPAAGFTTSTASSPRLLGDSVVKPRPFELSVATEDALQGRSSPTPTTPSYRISSASPFALPSSTQPTPRDVTPTLPTTFETVDSMINALAEMANDYSGETRPGLIIPPSAGPQTLHTLAVYFANALDGLTAGNEGEEEQVDDGNELDEEKKKLTELLTRMTMNRYNELFHEEDEVTTVSSRNAESEDSDLEGQHTKNAVESPKVRQLAQVFTKALSSYLDDPATFRKVLEEVRPTEPPSVGHEEASDADLGEDELLNFSDADTKSSFPPIYPTQPSVRPTWGYLIAYNTSAPSVDDVRNSLNPDAENLQLADSQSFVSQLNKLQSSHKDLTTKRPIDNLPTNHWTASPGVNKLWKTTFSFDPASINENFDATEPTIAPDAPPTEELLPPINEELPHHEIKYEVRAFPKVSLNSTQVHGILIDFMNTTKQDDTNRLQRILRKLNTTEDEFLSKMQEIETNPLTRRLILLLISECGANATKEIETQALPVHELLSRTVEKRQKELLETSSSNFPRLTEPATAKSSSNLKEIVDPSLDESSEDTRALQLLNSLYTIASKFGK